VGPIGEQLRRVIDKAGEDVCGVYVFHRFGERLRSIRDAYEAARERCGFQGKLIHDLRRTAMVNLVNRGKMSIEQAKELTGHRDANVARRYNLHTNDDLRRAMEATRVTELPKL
jgi:integrase